MDAGYGLWALAIATQFSTYYFIRDVFFSQERIEYVMKVLMKDIPGTSPAIKDPVEARVVATRHHERETFFWWVVSVVLWMAFVITLTL